MSSITQDVRIGLRSLRRSRGFTIVSILTLAVGIGATSAIFSIVNSVLFQPLPYPDANDLVVVWRTNDRTDSGFISYLDFRDWRMESTSFSELGGHYMVTHRFEREYGTDELRGEAMTFGVLPLLGVAPALGRWFTEDEDRPGGVNVIILRHDMWSNRYGGDSSLVGRSIVVDDEPVTVVGVMPPGFSFPTADTEFWVPGREDEWLRQAGIEAPGRDIGFLSTVGRLRPGVEIAAASREIQSIAVRIETAEPSDRQQGVRLERLHDVVTGGAHLMLFTFLGAVVMVLAIACANVANLALARAASRQREISVRTALGAGRLRLIRQQLTESTILAVFGGAIGVLIAFGAVDVFRAVGSSLVPRGNEIHVDGFALAFTAAITLMCGVAFGLFPAVQASSRSLTLSLRDETRGTTGARRTQFVRNTLVVVQVASALVLLTAGGLLTNSFMRLTDVDPGFDTENVLTARVEPPEDRFADNDEAVVAFHDELVTRVMALPGVTKASTSYSLPFTGSSFRQIYAIEGENPGESTDGPWAGTVIVGDGYFEAAGINMLRGRVFDVGDRGGPPVAVINETMANQAWPGQDPINKRFQIVGAVAGSVGSLERRFYSRDWMTVVGVASDVRRSSLGEATGAEFYRPHAQMAWVGMSLLVRTADAPERLVDAIRRQVWEVDPGAAVTDVSTMQQLVARSVATPRFRTVLLTAFAVAAGMLAIIGVYGVMAYVVAQRTQEIGIRMALGARHSNVLQEVMLRGLSLTGLGVAVGLVSAIVAARVLSSMLFGISAHDPATFAGSAILLVSVGTLACYFPARKASRVDPLIALREE